MSLGIILTGAFHLPVPAFINPHIVFNINLYLPTVRVVVEHNLKTNKKDSLLSLVRAQMRVCCFLRIVTHHYIEVIAVWKLIVAHGLQIDGFQSEVDAH